MHISFNGVIKPYTYNCPYAYKLRNIDKIYPEDVLPKEEPAEEEEVSKRTFGIEQHDLAARYIQGEDVEFNFSTDTIELLRNNTDVEVEKTEYFDLNYCLLPSRPSSGDYISKRCDAVLRTPYTVGVFDLKFGNPDYGQTIYYDETDFFVMLEAFARPDYSEWRTEVHFPIHDYSLPTREYNYHRMSRLQQRYMMRIDRIMNDKFCKPEPSTAHCRFCDYRSIESGGCGVCEHSIL